MEREKNGSITVFFALTFLLIVSFIGSMLYAALTIGAKTMGERVLSLAGESVLAGYYRPLFEEYHILAKAYSGGVGVYPGQLLEEECKQWVLRNLEIGADEAGTGVFAAHDLRQLEISSVDYLLNEQRETLIDQAAEYQKYDLAKDAVTHLLNLGNALSGTGEASKVLEAKASVEEQYMEAASDVAELMKCVDGVTWKKKFLFWGTELAGADRFVKQLWVGSVTPQSTGINHPTVFLAVQEQYVRADFLFAEAGNRTRELVAVAKREISVKEELTEVLLQLKQLEKGKQEELRKQLIELKKELEQEQKTLASARAECETDIKILLERLQISVGSSAETGQKALDIIARIEKKLAAAETAMIAFEVIFEGVKDSLNGEFAAQIEQEIAIYKQDGGIGYDLGAAREELTRRAQVLSDLSIGIVRTQDALEEQEYEEVLSCIAECERISGQLSWRGPAFDYSEYNADAEECEPLEMVENLMNKGISALVLPEGTKVSKSKIKTEVLPSAWYQTWEGAKEWTDGGKTTKTDRETDGFTVNSLFSMDLTDFLQAGADKLLFAAYAGDHFGTYVGGVKEMETTVQYEQEYLIIGDERDSDNLNAVITRILLLRALVNLISLTADSEAREKALALAGSVTALVGVPVLKIVLTSLLLLLWAVELAVVEVSAMMAGERVLVLPEKASRPVLFEELFLMTPSALREKAEQYEEAVGGMKAGYTDYVSLFLLALDRKDLNGRGLDLIELNIREWYDGEFRILNCVCGFSATMQATVTFRFPRISLIENFYGKEGMKYERSTHFSY